MPIYAISTNADLTYAIFHHNTRHKWVLQTYLYAMEKPRRLNCGFLKKWFHYECTSCQLNISSHQNLFGLLVTSVTIKRRHICYCMQKQMCLRFIVTDDMFDNQVVRCIATMYNFYSNLILKLCQCIAMVNIWNKMAYF